MDIYYIHVSRNITSQRKEKRLKQTIWRHNALATHGDTLARTYKNCGLKSHVGLALYLGSKNLSKMYSKKSYISVFTYLLPTDRRGF